VRRAAAPLPLSAGACYRSISPVREALSSKPDVRRSCDDKTEMIWFGSRSNLAKLQHINLSPQVGTSNIQPSIHVVRDLGVYMDSELTMKEHVAKIAAACFYHIRRLRQVRRRVGQ